MNRNKEPLFPSFNIGKYFLAKNLKKDIPASIVVFLVALPLCLGIALASGAPLFAGLLTGIIGGIITASFSGSQLSVSGPAAGLTVIVLTAITDLGAYEVFLVAVVIAGILQIGLGLLRAGTIGNYFPSTVIEGMLAAIGIILILKQLPHALGYNASFDGDESFRQMNDQNTFTAIVTAIENMAPGAVIICAVSMAILIFWPKIKKIAAVPAPLIVVVSGIVLGILFEGTSLALNQGQLVQIPVVGSFNEFIGLFTFPDFSAITNPNVWKVGATIAIIASIETLLSLEAVDKIDPIKRVSPTNRELIAQGIGNSISGLLGGLPMTAVIVRSSANVNAGGRTKMSAILHGAMLLLSLLFIPTLLNMIPLACLAAILLFTGYKLAHFGLFSRMWKSGKERFIPFVVTVLMVVFTDLLTGVAVGMLVAILYILRNNLRNPYFYKIEKNGNGDPNTLRIKLSEEVSFLNKGAIQYTLTNLPSGARVIIDGTNSKYIDPDVVEIIENFHHHAHTKKITVELVNISSTYNLPKLQDMVVKPEDLHHTNGVHHGPEVDGKMKKPVYETQSN
jgi:MFS superfamily sulfate permease-like transporter